MGIALCMIVRDEEHVLARCIDSVRPLISAAVIVDTGSSDGTVDLARKLLEGLPGEVVHRPWRDFGHNRTEALELARRTCADYALVIDADDELDWDEAFALPTLTAAGYALEVHDDAGLRYWRPQLLRLDAPWRFVGAIHEVAELANGDAVGGVEQLAGLRYLRHHDGRRRQTPQATAERDIEVLRRAVAERPDDARSVFYLAQTLREAGRLEEAIEWYGRRVAMGGWEEEAFVAMLEIGVLHAQLPGRRADAQDALAAAWLVRPHRAEPLVHLARLHNEAGHHALAHLAASTAKQIPYPNDDVLFIDAVAYGAGRRLEAMIAYRRLGDHAEAMREGMEILRDPACPARISERARRLLAELAEDAAPLADAERETARMAQRQLVRRAQMAAHAG